MQVNFEYEKECSHCDGRGYKKSYRFEAADPEDYCIYCEGRGTELTDEGKKLAEFITKYFGIKAPKTMLKDKYDTKEVPNPLYEDC